MRSSKPPPLPLPDADQDLNEAAQRLWRSLRRMPWLIRIGIGFPEPCLHLYVKNFSPEQKFYMRNGWSGFKVIVHVEIKPGG